MSVVAASTANRQDTHMTKRRRLYEDNHRQWMRTVNTVHTQIVHNDLMSNSTRSRAYASITASIDALDMDMMVNHTTTTPKTMWMALLLYILDDCTENKRLNEINSLVVELTRVIPSATWNLNARDKFQRTCLHIAVMICGCMELKSIFLEFLGALMNVCDREARDQDGDTPITFIIALIQHSVLPHAFRLLRFMVEKGANPSAQNNQGNTFLHIVAYDPAKCMNIMVDLMRHELLGVDWTLQNEDGNTFCYSSNGKSVLSKTPMRELCEGWVARCMSFLHDEVNEVLKNRHLTDIVMMYIDGHDDATPMT
jgi:hypothetical protein